MAASAARTITRFGRTYSEYDPDGGGGGPATWILATAGKGGAGAPGSGGTSGSFVPPLPTTVLRAGQAVFFTAPGIVDQAIAHDAAAAGLTQPYQVVGLAAADATNGQLVALITDGQLSLADWTAVTGAVSLQVNQRYYLSDLGAGLLTMSCPTTAGSTVVCVGQAISQQTFEVEIDLMVRN